MMNNDDISVKAVELLFTKQRRTFLNLAMSMVHDAEIAEDILHDSFISLWEKRESVDDFIDWVNLFLLNQSRLMSRLVKKMTMQVLYMLIILTRIIIYIIPHM